MVNVAAATGTHQVTAINAGVPAGVIAMWSGLKANIPSGWALCDGTGGTPDLRNRFIWGVGDAEEAGGTGGLETHAHDAHPSLAHSGAAVADHTDVINHTHPISVTDPTHGHDQMRHATTTGTLSGITTAPDASSSNPQVLGPKTGAASTGITATSSNPTGGVPALAHTVTQPSAHPAQSHVATDHKPPYYKLCYIIKL